MGWNKFLATLAMLIVSATAFAEREQSFFIELFGASTSLGIHYDSRFSDNTRWGGRIGIAYTYSRSQDFFEAAPERSRGWSCPHSCKLSYRQWWASWRNWHWDKLWTLQLYVSRQSGKRSSI